MEIIANIGLGQEAIAKAAALCIALEAATNDERAGLAARCDRMHLAALSKLTLARQSLERCLAKAMGTDSEESSQ